MEPWSTCDTLLRCHDRGKYGNHCGAALSDASLLLVAVVGNSNCDREISSGLTNFLEIWVSRQTSLNVHGHQILMTHG
jgi:hypothetical protein